MRVRRLFALVVIGTMLVTGACGDDEGSSGDDVASGSKAESGNDDGDGAEKRDPAAEEELAESVALQLDDFPAGWTQTDEEEDGEGGEESEAEDESSDPFDDCGDKEAEDLDDATTAEAESPQFEKGDTSQVFSLVLVLETEADAEKGFEFFGTDVALECIEEAFTEGIAEEAGDDSDVQFGEVTTKRASPPDAGDDALAYQFLTPFSAADQEFEFYTNMVVFRAGRVIAVLFANNLGEPLDADTQNDLAGAMAERAEAA